MCDGIQDCVGGTDEVNCGFGKNCTSRPSKTLHVSRNYEKDDLCVSLKLAILVM